MPATSDAIVVGAGIVGAACGEALARDGWRVSILEQAFAASGTTAAGMGHIVVMDDSPEQLALTVLRTGCGASGLRRSRRRGRGCGSGSPKTRRSSRR
jgi:glycine/D-amino acid oxidase-like deaminating enzyme